MSRAVVWERRVRVRVSVREVEEGILNSCAV